MTKRLFAPGYFSVPRPAFEPDDSAEVRDVLSRVWGLRVSSVARVKAFGLNSSNWRVRTKAGTFVLKRAAKEKTALAKQTKWTQALAASGFPTVRFVKAKSGELVVRDGEFLYCLSRFEGGVHLGKSVKRWEELLRREAALLAYCKRHPVRGAWPRRDFFGAEERRALASVGRADIAYVRAKYDQLRALPSAARGVFHIDIHPLNVLFRGGKLAALVDFDSFCVTGLEISFGFSLFKCARELLVGYRGAAFTRQVRRLERVSRLPFPELLAYGQIDLMKRLLGVAAGGPKSPWRFMYDTQLLGLKESDAMIAACAPGKLKSASR